MPKKGSFDYEVIIVGGGPTGLSAALVLGRCLRSVLVCDSQDYRNAVSPTMHGFLTRDGISPQKFRDIAHRELRQFPHIDLAFNEVTSIIKEKNGFKITMDNRKHYRCRKVLLAIGRQDQLPDIPNFERYYGQCIFHCPYCDGYEWQNKAIAVIGHGKEGYEYALGMLQWSKNIIYCTHGKRIHPFHARGLKANGIITYAEQISNLSQLFGKKLRLHFPDFTLVRDAIFFDYSSACPTKLLQKLGCKLNKDHSIIHNKLCVKAIQGLYVAGDACHEIFQAISSAGQGVEAAIYINQALTTEDLKH